MIVGRKINFKQMEKMLTKGAKLFDVRSPVEFRDGTLPNAVNLAVRQISSLLHKVPRTSSVIFFGSDDQLTIVLNYVHQMGFLNILILDLRTTPLHTKPA